MTTPRILALIAAEFESVAGASTSANQTSAGYWKRTALAAEAIADATTTAATNELGYIRRACLATEAFCNFSANSLRGENAYINRMVLALQSANGETYSGSLEWRLYQGITNYSASPPVGNLIEPATWAEAVTLINSTAVDGDVISMDHDGYTDDTPRTLTVLRAMGSGAKLTIRFRASQPVRITANALSDVNMEFNNAYLSGDAVAGNFAETSDNDGVYLTGVSGIAITGSLFGQSYNCLRAINCTDITVGYCVFSFARDNFIQQYSGANRIFVHNCLFRDAITSTRAYSSFDGSPPVFSYTNPGGSYSQVWDPNHADIWQIFSGIANNCYFYNCDGRGYFQGIWFTVDGGGSQSFNRFEGNTLQTAFQNTIMNDVATSMSVIGNTILQHPDPLAALPKVAGGRASGTGSLEAQNNVLAPSTIVDYGGLDITSPTLVSVGTVTPVTLPSFVGTDATVGGLTIPRVRPSYTEYAGGPVMQRDPFIVGPSAGPFDVGDWLNVIPEGVKGYEFEIEDTYQYRWLVDGVVVSGSTGIGSAYANYQVTGGDEVTAEVNTGDGVWRATAPVAINAAPSGTTLDPTRKSSNIALSGGDLVATQTTNDGSHSLAKSIADIPVADGNYVWALTCTNIVATTQMGIAIVVTGFNVNADPHDFGGNIGIFSNGRMYGSNGISNVDIGGMGSAGTRYSDGEFLIYYRRSGTTDKLFIRYPNGTWATNGGNPTSGGAGIDVSAALGNKILTAPAYTQKVGDVMTMNYTPDVTGLGSVILLV